MLLNRRNSSSFTRTFCPRPTLHTARRMNDVRFEYSDSWMDATRDLVRVIGTPASTEARTADFAAIWERLRRNLITVAFIANLIISRGINQMISCKAISASTKSTNEGNKDYPNPDDSNPTNGDPLNFRKLPISETSNDRGYKLCQAEATHQCV